MPNPRSLPIAIDPRSFNMTARSGNCDANIRDASRPGGWHPHCSRKWHLARSPIWLADRQPHRPDGDIVSPIVMYGTSEPGRRLGST